MAMDFLDLEARYLTSCKNHAAVPNSAIRSWFSKIKVQKSWNKKIGMAVSLDPLKDADILPLVDVLMESESSFIYAIDILCESHCVLSNKILKYLVNAIDYKLRIVDLCERLMTKELLRDLCQGGFACEVLRLRSNNIQKLNMSGRFTRLRTLNLDFCTALTSLQQDCFTFMPCLFSLSMCETRIMNLRTTTATLSKLPSLKELRFQNCLCCKDTSPCLSSENFDFPVSKSNHISVGDSTLIASSQEKIVEDLLYLNESVLTSAISSYLQDIELWEFAAVLPDGKKFFQNEIGDNIDFLMNVKNKEVINSSATVMKYVSHHPSPICFEKHYREYMVTSLPGLEVLDNMPITKNDRVVAKNICVKYFEYLPYKRRQKESIVSLLHKRELGASKASFQKTSKPRHDYSSHPNKWFFSRSLCAAKLGSCDWPLLHPISKFSQIFKEESKSPRPRQFEYHPSDPSLMAFGTLGGEVVAINHENGNTIKCIPSMGSMSSILGLCWLKKCPSLLIAGSDNGSLRLYDINHIPPKQENPSSSSAVLTFESFEQLTSLHVNSTDDKLLTSGYSKHVALYDIVTGKRLQTFSNIHREPINVAKFAYHSPFIFSTSSFDRDVKMWDLRQNPFNPCFTTSSSRGNVMVCFSPDDLYLLVSAVDNEVKQISAVDGRLVMNLDIASTGSAHNYTRSYYMNGRDYIISGSCDEHVVRICCAQTGKRLRDVYLEDSKSGNSMFVQSLRSDPFREFNMSILAASKRSNLKWEIIKVNLLASSDHYAEECPNTPSFST